MCERCSKVLRELKVHVSLLQTCKFEQTPNLCFSRERCVLARVCASGKCALTTLHPVLAILLELMRRALCS